MKNWYIKIWKEWGDDGSLTVEPSEKIIVKIPSNLKWDGYWEIIPRKKWKGKDREILERDLGYSEAREYSAVFNPSTGDRLYYRVQTQTNGKIIKSFSLHPVMMTYWQDDIIDCHVFADSVDDEVPEQGVEATVEELLDGIGLTAAIREHEQEEASASK